MDERVAGEETRFILFHKHHASARTRFLCLHNNTVFYPQSLPELSQHMDETVPQPPESVVELHPATLLKGLADSLGIATDALELEPEFDERVDVPAGVVRVYLVRFTAIDPPFDLAEALDGRFIDLTQARMLSDTELLLLRRSYEVIMEG